MWFRKRKFKNRRLGQIHVLDVKMRSDVVRRSRMRMVTVGLLILSGTLLGIYVVWRVGELALNRMIYQNKTFAIAAIEVQTDGVISPAQICNWAGVQPGQNLMALDLARAKRNLELSPQLATVSIERVLPRTLRIRVTEREAVAQVQVMRGKPGGGAGVDVFHFDLDGFVMVPLDPRRRTAPLQQVDDSLPVLTGVKFTELSPGRQVDTPSVRAALRLIADFGCSPMAGLVDLRSIDVSSPEVLVATTGQGSVVTFALEDFEKQLRRWREIHDMGQRMNRNLATLDLAVPNNIPARWLEASVVPQKPVRPAKQLRNRKKNV